MANNSAAYIQVKPNQENISQDIQYWNQDRQKRRAEQRTIDEIERAKQEKIKSDRETLIGRVKSQNEVWDTGSSSGNEMIRRFMSTVKSKYPPLLEVLDPNSSSTMQERVAAQSKLDNLNNTTENLKATFEGVTKKRNDYLTAVNSGLSHRDPKMDQTFQSQYNGAILGLDENYMPNVVFLDTNNDGLNDNISGENVLGISGINSLTKDDSLFNQTPRFSKNTIAENIAKDMGSETTQKGIKKTTKWAENNASTRVNSLFQKDENGSFSPEAKSLLIDEFGMSNKYTDTQVDDVKKEMTKLIKTYETTSETNSYSGRTSSNPNKVKPVFGEKFDDIYTTDKNVGPTTKSIPLYDDITFNRIGNQNNFTAESFTINKDGKIVLRGVTLDTKSETKKGGVERTNHNSGGKSTSLPSTYIDSTITLGEKDQASFITKLSEVSNSKITFDDLDEMTERKKPEETEKKPEETEKKPEETENKSEETENKSEVVVQKNKFNGPFITTKPDYTSDLRYKVI